MNLYFVQDTDRPMHIVADSYGEAVTRWQKQIQRENDSGDCDHEEPQGVTLVAEGSNVDEFPSLLLPVTP